MPDNSLHLNAHFNQLRAQYKEQGYSEFDPLTSDHEFVQAGLIRGVVQGNQTPRILIIVLDKDHWEYSNEARLDELAYELLATVADDWPVFAHLEDPDNSRCFALFGLDGADGTHSVDEVPALT